MVLNHSTCHDIHQYPDAKFKEGIIQYYHEIHGWRWSCWKNNLLAVIHEILNQKCTMPVRLVILRGEGRQSLETKGLTPGVECKNYGRNLMLNEAYFETESQFHISESRVSIRYAPLRKKRRWLMVVTKKSIHKHMTRRTPEMLPKKINKRTHELQSLRMLTFPKWILEF